MKVNFMRFLIGIILITIAGFLPFAHSNEYSHDTAMLMNSIIGSIGFLIVAWAFELINDKK